MKKLNIMASMLIGLALFASSCDSDRDDNPVLSVPTGEFALNQPAIGQQPVDLQVSTAIELQIAEQPAYGYPAPVNYSVQMSLDNDFADSTKFYDIDYTTSSMTLKTPASEMDKGVMQLLGAPDEKDFNADTLITVYLRAKAKLSSDNTNSTTTYSNVQSIKVYPYWLSMTPAEPVFWYMTGSCFGDGAWTDKSWQDNIPMSEVKSASYDSKGLGDIESIIYLPADAIFKLRASNANWDAQWGMNDGAFVKNDGGSGNIVPSDGAGYYILHYNTAKDEVTLKKSETQDYKTYTSMSLIGTLNGTNWDTDVDMTPVNGTAGVNNHIWWTEVTVADGEVFKFRADHAWDANWGYGAADGDVNLKGFATSGGHNVGVTAGTYDIYLNDIDGFYRMIKVSE